MVYLKWFYECICPWTLLWWRGFIGESVTTFLFENKCICIVSHFLECHFCHTSMAVQVNYLLYPSETHHTALCFLVITNCKHNVTCMLYLYIIIIEYPMNKMGAMLYANLKIVQACPLILIVDVSIIIHLYGHGQPPKFTWSTWAWAHPMADISLGGP